MFVDFEGIDGSGKTSLSNAVCQELRRQGLQVRHAREGGHLATEVARRVRELTRDARLLEMGGHAELFLNLARDAQQIDEVIRPALDRGEICLTDRYLYSHLALACARGLPRDAVEPALRLASRGLRPDVVVLTDVDPELARLRKRVGKVLAGRASDGESRKSLAGAGLQVRIRERLRDLAGEDPGRWIVVRNEGRTLHDLVERVVGEIVARLRGQPPPPAREPERPERPVRNHVTMGDPLDSLAARLFAELDALAEREPALSVFLLTGIPGPAAHRRRLEHAASLPGVVAHSLRELHDDASLRLRRALARVAPVQTAESLAGDASPAAMALRRELAPAARAAVLRSLEGIASAQAWELRSDALASGALGEVLEGLAGVDGDLSWELREEGVRRELWGPVARSVGGLADARADALRARLLERDPLAVLRGCTGLETPVAQRARVELFERAPKRVLRSLTGVAAPYAWALRERAAPQTKEALDSVDGMDHPAAWSLRERFVGLWPATAVSSLEHLALSTRGRALMEQALRAYPDRLTVLCNAYAATAVARAALARPDPPVRPRSPAAEAGVAEPRAALAPAQLEEVP